MTSDDEPDELDPRVEWKYRAWAVPIALVLALAFNRSGTGHWFQRTFLTMIPHEVGHAVTGWWCGFASIPGLWKTLIPDERGTVVPVVLVALEVGLAWLGWRTQRTWLVVVALGLGALQLLGTTRSVDAAHVAITYGGDGGAMVIGTLLVLAFFAPEGSKLRAGALRWGLLVIGAAAYVDTAMTWWRARSDHDLIPFGEIEGVGLSDPSRLSEAGWTPATIIGRYVTLAGLCLATIVGVWAWQTWQMRQRAR
ncbi:MAG: hypothetical protein NT062_12215 [Proteobacteria bacterium]|nr:hypothetical protein [Pseudomonadota bacterium]